MTASPAGSTRKSIRDLNRVAVLEEIYRNPGAVRSEIQERTGLSRATIFRIIDELTSEGYLAETPVTGDRSPGRPKLQLFVAPERGVVCGADIGVLTTRIMLSDLNARILVRRRINTPTDLSSRKLASWLHREVRDMMNETADFGPLVHAVVSVPAAVTADGEIRRPAGHLSYLAGVGFRDLLINQFGVQVDLRRDPDMALIGEMKIGQAAGYEDVVMIVASSSLAGSIAVNGKVRGGRRHLIGEYGAMPAGNGRSLGDLLTVPGIRGHLEKHGISYTSAAALLEEDLRDRDAVRDVLDGVRDGLVTLLASIIVNTDPEIVVFTGSLLPVIGNALPAVEEELHTIFGAPLPQLALSTAGGFSQPRGALEVALQAARITLSEEVLQIEV